MSPAHHDVELNLKSQSLKPSAPERLPEIERRTLEALMCQEFGFQVTSRVGYSGMVIFSRDGIQLALALHHTSSKFSPLVVGQLLSHFNISMAKFNKALRSFTRAA